MIYCAYHAPHFLLQFIWFLLGSLEEMQPDLSGNTSYWPFWPIGKWTVILPLPLADFGFFLSLSVGNCCWNAFSFSVGPVLFLRVVSPIAVIPSLVLGVATGWLFWVNSFSYIGFSTGCCKLFRSGIGFFNCWDKFTMLSFVALRRLYVNAYRLVSIER